MKKVAVAVSAAMLAGAAEGIEFAAYQFRK
jgi:hypothetical protein